MSLLYLKGLPPIPELIDYHRKLNCPKYGLCLEMACVFAWNSFSCSRCKGEGPDPFLIRAYRYRLLNVSKQFKIFPGRTTTFKVIPARCAELVPTHLEHLRKEAYEYLVFDPRLGAHFKLLRPLKKLYGFNTLVEFITYMEELIVVLYESDFDKSMEYLRALSEKINVPVHYMVGILMESELLEGVFDVWMSEGRYPVK